MFTLGIGILRVLKLYQEIKLYGNKTEGTGLWAKICTPITSNLDFKIRLRLCEVTVTANCERHSIFCVDKWKQPLSSAFRRFREEDRWKRIKSSPNGIPVAWIGERKTKAPVCPKIFWVLSVWDWEGFFSNELVLWETWLYWVIVKKSSPKNLSVRLSADRFFWGALLHNYRYTVCLLLDM